MQFSRGLTDKQFMKSIFMHFFEFAEVYTLCLMLVIVPMAFLLGYWRMARREEGI